MPPSIQRSNAKHDKAPSQRHVAKNERSAPP